ncbi:MAG TPA: glycosyltransferase family 2 protein [Gemmatimonadaceae bacterium]|nr:glycosyltransferase family 2 protein [Gemmatimonadaceae bacterium]
MSASVVVILPAYNAETTLAPVVRGIRSTLPSAFLLGINDGSADGTAALLRSVCDSTIDFPENRGKGAALRAAFDAALQRDCSAVLTIDSDGQHDPAFAPSLLAALRGCHIAIGTRDLTGEQVPKHRRIANMLSSAATRMVSGGAVRDSQSGYRAIRREVLEEVKAEGDRYEFETDFIIRAAHAGFTITNVPISTIYGPQSYFREFHDAMLVMSVLWRHKGAVVRKYSPRTVGPLTDLD